MPSVGADARVQYRLEFVFIDFDGSRHARRNIGEEQLSVDGEGHAVAACVGGIADDSGTAFARTFATRPFFSGNVFGVGIGEQLRGSASSVSLAWRFRRSRSSTAR